jgi:hypothetical protein
MPSYVLFEIKHCMAVPIIYFIMDIQVYVNPESRTFCTVFYGYFTLLEELVIQRHNSDMVYSCKSLHKPHIINDFPFIIHVSKKHMFACPSFFLCSYFLKDLIFCLQVMGIMRACSLFS